MMTAMGRMISVSSEIEKSMEAMGLEYLKCKQKIKNIIDKKNDDFENDKHYYDILNDILRSTGEIGNLCLNYYKKDYWRSTRYSHNHDKSRDIRCGRRTGR